MCGHYVNYGIITLAVRQESGHREVRPLSAFAYQFLGWYQSRVSRLMFAVMLQTSIYSSLT